MPFYAFEAGRLLSECVNDIQEVIQAAEDSKMFLSCLYDFRETLVSTEALLFDHFSSLLETERLRSSSANIQALFCAANPRTLSDAMKLLENIIIEKNNREAVGRFDTRSRSRRCYYPSRSAADSMLFRLIVALQLCIVRLDDARLITSGKRRSEKISHPSTYLLEKSMSIALMTMFGAASGILFTRHVKIDQFRDTRFLIKTSAQAASSIVMLLWLRKKWNNVWMSQKVIDSKSVIETWNRQWQTLRVETSKRNTSPKSATSHEQALDYAKSRRLVEYALHDSPKSSLWHSQGELRFLMLKRVMDVFYASVDTAVEMTGKVDSTNWQLTLTAAAAASFYSLIGVSTRVAEATSTSYSARRLIQSAWGMVSLPSIKNLSLQASKLLKGATVADRIEIAGVSCFVLSREPAPELAAAIKRFHRKHGRQRPPVRRLTTIDEYSDNEPLSHHSFQPFTRSSGPEYRQRDVILHLSGGGFFCHIIASDLPYLLDWSASTGAVVICPEYALLPNHIFPDALREVEAVYRALLSDDAASTLGFEVNRIIVTGESTGGNLATSLCIKLCMDADAESSDIGSDISIAEGPSESIQSIQDQYGAHSSGASFVRLPDALMLSCAVLNLSLEPTWDTEDPVLPGKLISAISDAYLPPDVPKDDPLVSPLFADDHILCRFPPTLLFASSNDPTLDDSVAFNQRLKSSGVESGIRAVPNVPHAYWGLGTAGFPEAQQVQEECQEWLRSQFAREGHK